MEELEKLSKGEMLSMLKFGADRIFASEEGQAPTDKELAAIIDRSVSLGQSGVRACLHCTCQLGLRRNRISACMLKPGTPSRGHLVPKGQRITLQIHTWGLRPALNGVFATERARVDVPLDQKSTTSHAALLLVEVCQVQRGVRRV